MTMAQGYHDPIASLVTIDSFFAGDTGPPITFIFVNQNGGLIDLSNFGSAIPIIEIAVRVWDPTKRMPRARIVTAGIATILDQTTNKGQAQFDWMQAGPLDCVPRETGWYVIQANVTFPNGQGQGSQRALFQVLPASDVS